MEDLKSIRTEQRNPETMHIDELSTLDMVRLINREDHRVAEAVAHVCPQIAQAVDIIAAHLHGGGTVAAVGGLAALLQVLLTAAVGVRQLQQLRRENHHIGLLRLGLVVGILLCHGKSSLRGAG